MVSFASNRASDEYVGYCHPPVVHQFKPGNKFGKGRKKGSKNMKTILRDFLENYEVELDAKQLSPNALSVAKAVYRMNYASNKQRSELDNDNPTSYHLNGYELIALNLIRMAFDEKNNLKALTTLIDYVDGKPKQQFEYKYTSGVEINVITSNPT